MKSVLSVLGTGVYLPPARPVREVVMEAGAAPSAYQGWDNCCHALEEDHPSTMGTTALRRALENSNVDAAELKLVLFAGMSRDYLPSWSVSMEIMKACEIGTHCMGLDLTVGCLGVLSALDMAQGWLSTHGGGVAAIVTAERWTYTIDYTSIENMGLWIGRNRRGWSKRDRVRRSSDTRCRNKDDRARSGRDERRDVCVDLRDDPLQIVHHRNSVDELTVRDDVRQRTDDDRRPQVGTEVHWN